MALQTQGTPILAVEERTTVKVSIDNTVRTIELALQIRLPEAGASASPTASPPLVEQHRAARPVQALSIELPRDWGIPRLHIERLSMATCRPIRLALQELLDEGPAQVATSHSGAIAQTGQVLERLLTSLAQILAPATELRRGKLAGTFGRWINSFYNKMVVGPTTASDILSPRLQHFVDRAKAEGTNFLVTKGCPLLSTSEACLLSGALKTIQREHRACCASNCRLVILYEGSLLRHTCHST